MKKIIFGVYLKDKNQLDHVIDFDDKKRVDRVKDDNWMKGGIISDTGPDLARKILNLVLAM